MSNELANISTSLASDIATLPASESNALHPRPVITQNMTTAHYMQSAHAMHNEQHTKKGPPSWLRWVGDATIAVFPIRRVCCAIGLTAGLLLTSIAAKVVSGHELNGTPVDKNSLPTFLQPLHKIIKYDPKASDSKNRWIGVGLAALYALGGFIGVKIGAWYSYRDVYEKNKNPEYIEDYTARVSMHHGDKWSWLAAFGSIFGSSSGNILTPLPAYNYGFSLAASSIGTKDQNFMLPHMSKSFSGNTTISSYGVRDALNELCKYAANNPSKNPIQLEYYAYTVLGQMFGNQVTPKHIEQFVDAVHTVRDNYWQEGGIPDSSKKEAMEDMKAHFRGKGFETLLDQIGLDPGKIDFLQLKGLVGKFSNAIGTKKVVLKEQEEFRTKLNTRRAEESNKTKENNTVDPGLIAQIDEIGANQPENKPVSLESYKKPRVMPQSFMERAEPVPGQSMALAGG